MIKRATLLFGVIFGSLATATAAETPPDNAVVSATIAALRSGDTQELNWLVSHSGRLQFPWGELPQKHDVFRILAGCKAKEKTRGQVEVLAYYEFEWKCRKGFYVGKLVLDKAGASGGLVDFLTKAEHEEISRRIPYIMLPPKLASSRSPPAQPSQRVRAELELRRKAEMAKMIDLAGRFAKAAAEGDMTNLSRRHSIGSDITYGFFNPYLEQEFIDRSWATGESLDEADKALAGAVAYAHKHLGKPQSWACEDAEPYVECTWRFADPSASLKSKILVFRPETEIWGIKVFWLRYETPITLAEAKRRAAR